MLNNFQGAHLEKIETTQAEAKFSGYYKKG